VKNIYDGWKEDGVLDSILVLIRKWTRNGATKDEIAVKLGLNRSTFFRYMKDYEDIKNALKKGREVCDSEVENSLIKECVGYYYDETFTTKTAVIDKVSGKLTDLEKVEMKTIKRYARPNTLAIIYYLNNRLPSDWKQRVVNDGQDNGMLPELVALMSKGKGGKVNEQQVDE